MLEIGKKDGAKGYELVNFCESDKFAIKSYCAIHGVDESLNLGDITKVDGNNLKPFNMICGGSPCTDFSVAGKQAGSRWHCKKCGHEYNPLTVHYAERDACPKCKNTDLDKTCSSLLVEWLRIIRANKPDWGIYENVKNIVGKKFKDTFEMFIKELNEYGYNTHYKVLNAKDFGVPQNRERLYLLIIRKEIDNGMFEFPEGFELNKRLKDVLEDEVDEKYYVDTPEMRALIKDRDPGSRIRSPTPREYFRLMGFSDGAFEKAEAAGMSDSQLYRQAGNSIVVDVLYHIFRNLYGAMPYLFDGLRVGSFFSGIGAFETALDRVYADIYEEADGTMEGSTDPV